jgi:predicted transcriptional regulator
LVTVFNSGEVVMEILRNKNLATRFQILVEVASSGPNIQQRDIAGKLDITPQAVSEYVRQLVDEGLIASDGRSKYRVTSKGVNWIIKVLRELRNYDTFVEQAVTNISMCAAIADADLIKGQKVGLEMKDGLLIATDKPCYDWRRCWRLQYRRVSEPGDRKSNHLEDARHTDRRLQDGCF